MKNKLTKLQKETRKVMLNEYGYNVFAHRRVTVAYVITGHGKGKFAVAIAADGEEWSRKYGEYTAMLRLIDGICLPFEFDDNFGIENRLWDIAGYLQNF